MPIKRPTSIPAGKPPPSNVDPWIEVFDRPSSRMIIDPYRFPAGSSEINLFSLRAGYVNVNEYAGDYDAAKSFDSNTGTFSAGSDSAPARFGLDFGGTPRTVTRIEYYPRTGFESRMDGGSFYAANSADFSDEVAILTLPSGHTAQWYDAATTSSVSARYVYFKSSHGSPNSSSNIAEQVYWGS